jgi:ribosomal protein S5
VVKATIAALRALRRRDEILKSRGIRHAQPDAKEAAQS